MTRPAENAPMTREDALDALIEIGLRIPGLPMELRAIGEGYSVLVPVERLETLSRAFAARGKLLEAARETLAAEAAPSHPEAA